MRTQVVWAAACLATSLVASSASAQFSTDTCAADSVGLPCTYGTCIPGHCSSHEADGGSFDGPCVLCETLPGPYCPAANVGQPCEDGGVCLNGGGGAAGGGSSGGGGSGGSYFSEGFSMTWCGEAPSDAGGTAMETDAGQAVASTSSGGSSSDGLGVYAGISTSGDAGSGTFAGSSSSGGAGGDNWSSSGGTGSASGSGGQGTAAPNIDAGGGDTRGTTVDSANDAGPSGAPSGSGGGHTADKADAGVAGTADNGGGREIATGLACSLAIGRTGCSRLGFLALVGLGVTVRRRRRTV